MVPTIDVCDPDIADYQARTLARVDQVCIRAYRHPVETSGRVCSRAGLNQGIP
jgi:hypothetical protein